MVGAISTGMRWWLVLLIVASTVGTAWAQSATVTDQARLTMRGTEQRVTALANKRGQLGAEFQRENDAIDHLKHEKASWRRDRELRASLADSNDTASQLTTLDKQLTEAQAALATARAKLVQAIDAELAAGAPAPARASDLNRLRGQLIEQLRPPKKIVIPDAEIDPLADPEDLDTQAAALRATEQELTKQVTSLDSQAKEMSRTVDLRKQHERTNDLARRDDDQPLRSQAVSASHSEGLAPAAGAGSGSGTTATPVNGATQTDSFGGDRGNTNTIAGSSASVGGFESEATVVLGNVVDSATIDGLARASRSGDPAQRAEAAERLRDAVRARLELLQKKRAAVEARARQLRGGK
jgi:hypothetical protein